MWRRYLASSARTAGEPLGPHSRGGVRGDADVRRPLQRSSDAVGAGSFALRFRRSLSPPLTPPTPRPGLNTNTVIFSGQRDGSKPQDNGVCVQRQASKSGVKRQLRNGGKGEDGPGHTGNPPPTNSPARGLQPDQPDGHCSLSCAGGVSRQVGSEKFMSYSHKPKCTHEV